MGTLETGATSGSEENKRRGDNIRPEALPLKINRQQRGNDSRQLLGQCSLGGDEGEQTSAPQASMKQGTPKTTGALKRGPPGSPIAKDTGTLGLPPAV
ncbi:hypothetical protein NDU88_003692 [Pleurodeles waltl]|uniref:Uncharacterized protein n=1 Tax=Pleurodeles waltl TaxID=8319 RepID=A0AAV7VI26_PLEWA|nr:hypothetical protein NDU88_003692 [Pleurodeles waltl]